MEVIKTDDTRKKKEKHLLEEVKEERLGQISSSRTTQAQSQSCSSDQSINNCENGIIKVQT